MAGFACGACPRISFDGCPDADAVRASIAQLREQGARAYVLDVRNNGGGLFPAGVEITKMFQSKGTIVYIADNDGELLHIPNRWYPEGRLVEH